MPEWAGMPCGLGQLQVRPVPAHAQVSRKALTGGASLPSAANQGSAQCGISMPGKAHANQETSF